MKWQFFSFFIFFFFFSCKKSTESPSEHWVSVTPRVSFAEENNLLKLRSGKHQYTLSMSDVPYKRVVLLNASLVGYFAALNAEESIVGISSPGYVYSDKVRRLIKNAKIQNVGNEQHYDIEQIIALKPDVIFTNYIVTFENTYNILRKNGIEVIFIDEYLEEKPLHKSAILKVFGKLIGKEKKSIAQYQEIENSYQELVKLASKETEKPLVLANELYGNQWFMPGGKSFVGNYVADANANYILSDNQDTKAVPMSFEEVFVKAKNADIWINAGNHKSKRELLGIQPNYAQMAVFQKGKIYAITAKEKGKANDFFESGVVRADWVLKDYIKIFHPELFPNEKLTFMKELK